MKNTMSYNDFCKHIGQCPVRDAVEAMAQYKIYKAEQLRVQTGVALMKGIVNKNWAASK